MNETLSQPRYMTTDEGIRNTLKNVEWVKNNNVLEEIMESHNMESYSKNDVIQELGEMHTELKILHKGILKMSGSNTGEKEIILPNTDTLNYFYANDSFITYVNSPQTLGLLGYLLQTPSVTRVDVTKDSKLISISFEKLGEIEERFGSLSFQMWRSVALHIAFTVLRDEQTYEKWSDEKLKIHLEEGILPNLQRKENFEVHNVVTDMVLIQGRMIDKETNADYVGPTYVPHSVRSLKLPDDPQNRPRVVLVMLREEKFHARTIMGWLETDEIKHIGLCIVHGMKRMSTVQQMNENYGQRKSIIQTLEQLFKQKSEHILQSEPLE